MYLKNLSLQNFRSYAKSSFTFNEGTTIIIGPNTSGKTNLIEAIYLLASGKSFRAEKDVEMVQFGQNLSRVKGKIEDTDVEVVLAHAETAEGKQFQKKYLVNGVSKRRVDFVGNLSAVVFSPIELTIVVDSPSVRRSFLDETLSQVDRDYRQAHITYIKTLRQRNALLERAQETGVRNEKQFEYWDTILIRNGQMLTEKREAFIAFINTGTKYIFDFTVIYDASIISKERLLQYKDAEVGAGVTLVGPHRDDFTIHMQTHNIKLFGSRGQQRLVVLQLKLLQLDFMENALGVRPLLLLDDIFSELDSSHIQLVSKMLGKQQTMLTTTHKEFVDPTSLKLRGASRSASVIELG